MDDLFVRLARPSEADALTKLAMAAKASWGYSDAFMEACRAELAITPAKMAAWSVWVAQLDATICGMIALNIGGRVLRVDADPNAENIYQKFGFATVGRSPSRSISGRTLPRMELRVSEGGIASE